VTEHDSVRVSIIVATKDRYETLFDCVRGLLSNYGGPDVEIIVRDNSSSPRAAEFNAAFADSPNLVYVADQAQVSQSENYELALREARGEYVTMIGDDDGIAWGMLELADWMKHNDVDAVFPGFSVYLWPGVSGRFSTANESGMLLFDSAPRELRMVDAARERRTVLSSGCTTLGDLPRLYYGLVRKHCLDQIRQEAGLYFPGPSPDMANAFTLSYYVSRFAVTSLPLFISGNSRKSNAGLGLRGQHVGEIRDLPFLPRDTVEEWNHDIPFFWSGQTIWCQSAYAAACAMGKTGEFEDRNGFCRLYAKLAVFQPEFLGRTFTAFRHRHAKSGSLVTAAHAIAILYLIAETFAGRVAGFLIRRIRSLLVRRDPEARIEGLINVSAAVREVDSTMRGMNFVQWLEDVRPAPALRTSITQAKSVDASQ
jgi:hypothetical protein